MQVELFQEIHKGIVSELTEDFCVMCFTNGPITAKALQHLHDCGWDLISPPQPWITGESYYYFKRGNRHVY